MSNVVEYPGTPESEWSELDHQTVALYHRLTAAFLAAGGGTFPRSVQLDGLTWAAVMDNDRYKFVRDNSLTMESAYSSTSQEPRFQRVSLDEKDFNVTPADVDQSDPTAKKSRKRQ